MKTDHHNSHVTVGPSNKVGQDDVTIIMMMQDMWVARPDKKREALIDKVADLRSVMQHYIIETDRFPARVQKYYEDNERVKLQMHICYASVR